MRNSIDFLDEIRRVKGLTSDYQLWHFMGWSPSRTSTYRTGRSEFDEETCLQVAAVLEIDPAVVLATVAAARAKVPAVRRTWLNIAKAHAARVAAPVALAGALGFTAMAGFPGDANASPTGPGEAGYNSLYIMLRRKRERLASKLHGLRSKCAGQRDLFSAPALSSALAL